MPERHVALPPVTQKGAEMTDLHILKGGAFDPETTKALGSAFEIVCKEKPRSSRELIANRIIQLAKGGEVDVIRLSEKVINELA